MSHHSATYRGQVVALLRSLGLQPASGDPITLLRDRGTEGG